MDNPDPPAPGYWDMSWQDRAIVDIQVSWLEPIPAQWRSVKDAPRLLHERRSGTPRSSSSWNPSSTASFPCSTAPPLPAGIRRPRTATLSVTVPMIQSVDLPLFGFPLPFDQTAEGRARNAACWASWAMRSVWLNDLLGEKLAEAGCTSTPTMSFFAGVNYLPYDIIMQLGVPSFFTLGATGRGISGL